MGPQHHTQQKTDTAMDEQPLNLPSSTYNKTDPISVDQALRSVGLALFPQEFFFIHVANRLYLSRGLS